MIFLSFYHVIWLESFPFQFAAVAATENLSLSLTHLLIHSLLENYLIENNKKEWSAIVAKKKQNYLSRLFRKCNFFSFTLSGISLLCCAFCVKWTKKKSEREREKCWNRNIKRYLIYEITENASTSLVLTSELSSFTSQASVIDGNYNEDEMSVIFFGEIKNYPWNLESS